MSEPFRAPTPSPANDGRAASSGSGTDKVPGKPRAKVIGRYALYDEFASGGMASLHFGRLYGSAGFARTVAIKRLHVNLAGQAEFVSMLVDEARLAARIRHPNVVPTLDVVSSDGELLLVMEYVHGLSLAQLLSAAADANVACPVPVAMAIACDTLRGLQCAHEAKSETGTPLELVHRDVSPQNVLVGTDGVTRVVDFGVAKAAGRIQETRDGELKGKVPYMAPEQLKGESATRRSDVYGAGVVLWESLTGRRLFRGENDASVWLRVLNDQVKAPSTYSREVSRELDDIVLTAVAKDPLKRFATALEMAKRIEAAGPLATPLEVGAWVEKLGIESLAHRAALLSRVEHAAAPSEPSVAEMISRNEAADLVPDGHAAHGRWIRVIGVVGAAALAFGLTAVLLRESTDPSVPEASASPTSSALSTSPFPTASASALEPPTEPDRIVVGVPDPRKTVDAGVTRATGAKTPTRDRVKPPPAPPKPSCDPPFVVDKNGRKEYKQHCL